VGDSGPRRITGNRVGVCLYLFPFRFPSRVLRVLRPLPPEVGIREDRANSRGSTSSWVLEPHHMVSAALGFHKFIFDL
jgi:hypothetical protein